MKRRIQIVGHENMALYPGEYPVANKYVHCVEGGLPVPGTSSAALHTGIVTVAGEDPNSGQRDPQSRVVVEWGPSEHFSGMGALDLLIRYRCGPFPSTGTFYLLIYNDPYQSQLHEVSQSKAWVFACVRAWSQGVPRFLVHPSLRSDLHIPSFCIVMHTDWFCGCYDRCGKWWCSPDSAWTCTAAWGAPPPPTSWCAATATLDAPVPMRCPLPLTWCTSSRIQSSSWCREPIIVWR
jgi:hypothetical protein